MSDERTHNDDPMPQIWLTYHELAQFLHCGPIAAREACTTMDMKRRRCSDGLTRAKLHPAMLAEYITYLVGSSIETADQTISLDIAKLRGLAAQVRRFEMPLDRRRA